MGNLYDKKPGSKKAGDKGANSVGVRDLVRGGDSSDFLSKKKEEGKFLELSPENFFPDPDQPRKSFDEGELQELRQSIEARGQLQPIAVTAHRVNGKYKIIAGERRWRAISGSDVVTNVQAVVIDEEADEIEVLLMQLDENNKRVVVPILENAAAMKRVVDICKANGGTQEDAAAHLNMAKGQLSKILSLLNIPDSVEALIAEGITQDVESVYNLARAVKKCPEKESEIIDLVRQSEESNVRNLSKKIVEEASGKPAPKDKKSDGKKKKAAAKVLKTDSVALIKEGDDFVLSVGSGEKIFKFSLDKEQLEQIKV